MATIPLTAAYIAAAALAEGAQDTAETSDAADEARDAARDAWRDSDEPREYQFGGDSYPGGERGHWHAPSEVEDALQEWTEGGDWDISEGTVYVSDWARPIDPVTGEMLSEVEVTSSHAFQPEEPECSEGEHDWQSPYEVLGGLKENPGVWGKGGGIVSKEVCAHCGAYRITDTWAQDRSSGAQGLTEVTYEDADDASRAWIQGARDEAMMEACPCSIERHNRRAPGRYVVAVEIDADDDDACDAVVAEVKSAIGKGWAVDWTGGANGDTSDLSIEWTGRE
jgi:hypothetical protein